MVLYKVRSRCISQENWVGFEHTPVLLAFNIYVVKIEKVKKEQNILGSLKNPIFDHLIFQTYKKKKKTLKNSTRVRRTCMKTLNIIIKKVYSNITF